VYRISGFFRKDIRMKMYILVRDDVPLGFAMVAVAHASLAGYLRFQDTPEVKAWLSGPFFKAVCSVNAKDSRMPNWSKTMWC